MKKQNEFFLYSLGTRGGSSGSPIILLHNFKVIGLHKGGVNSNENKINIGIPFNLIINKINYFNPIYYIPIFGKYSDRHSKILNVLISKELLFSINSQQNFICFFKYSKNIKFYQVNTKKEEILIFEKDGEEINGEENIIKKIDAINNNNICSKKEKYSNFYMLEFPLKNIENIQLIKNFIFINLLDIDFNDDSIDNIFSLFNINNIYFEIFIFDSESIKSDYMLNIIKRLSDINCLTKKNNIFNLNKLNIDEFRYYFYTNFEDEKNENNIFINIYNNFLIETGSLIYLDESKISENFSSLLMKEFYLYIDRKIKENKEEDLDFRNYIRIKVENIIINGNMKIDSELNKIKEKEIQIINESYNNFENIVSKIIYDFNIGIDMNKKKKQMQVILN